MKKNSAIVVTGARGLAGSAVVEHLQHRGYTCVIGLTREDCDLRDTADTAATIGAIQPEYVFHAAATVYGLGGNLANQGKLMFDNTLINTNVIHASRTAKKVVVMGTNAAFPWPVEMPYREEMMFNGRPHEGEAAYGHAKRHMLAMLEAYHASYGTEYSYLISGNLYGPRDTFNAETGHVLPSLVRKFHDALTMGGTVPVWGDGSQKRDFLYSSDLARIVHLMMSSDIKSGAINIGSGISTSIRELVQSLSKITGVCEDRVRYDTSKPTGRADCYSDLSRLHDLGFRPNVRMYDGLLATWEWFKHQGGAKGSSKQAA